MAAIVLKKTAAAGVATPATEKVAIYVDATSGEPSYKDDAGATASLKGATGATGPTGATGAGVPVGGLTGEALVKLSNTDYDTGWAAAPGGGGKSYITNPGLKPPDTAGAGDIEFASYANGVNPTAGPAMAWGNQGAASAAIQQGRLVMNSGTVTGLRALLKATPGAGSFTLDVMAQAHQYQNSHLAAIVMLWGTPGTPTAIRAAGRYRSTGSPSRFVWTTYNTSWAATADVANIEGPMGLEPFVMRLEWDGTNLIYKASPSGIVGTYAQVTSQALGLGRPDYVGVGVNSNGATVPSIAAFDFLRFGWTADFDPTTDN